MRASGEIWRCQASERMLDRRLGGLSQYKNEKRAAARSLLTWPPKVRLRGSNFWGSLHVASHNSLFLCLRETRTREDTQKEHPVSAVRVTAHPLLLPPRLCLLVAVERMFLLPSLYHRAAWKATEDNFISVSLTYCIFWRIGIIIEE